MSTYWGYYCKNCKQESDHWFNHGEKLLYLLLDMRKEVEGTYKLIEAIKKEAWRLLHPG